MLNRENYIEKKTGEDTTLTEKELEEALAISIKTDAYARRQLVNAETGKPTTLTGKALEEAKNNNTVITKAAYVMRQLNNQLVDAETGKPTTLTEKALEEAKNNKTVITQKAYDLRQLVDAETGEPTTLIGKALEDAKNNKTVITKNAYAKRQLLVDAETGKPTTLTGKALEEAKNIKTVITKNAYVIRQLVEAETGKPTTLTGEALEDAKNNKTVITKNAYDLRQKDRQLVEVETGKPTTLTGKALEEAKNNKMVITKNAYDLRQLVDAETGEPTTLTGKALEEAKNNKKVITKNAYVMRQFNNQLVDAETGKPTTLTGKALEEAKNNKTVITKATYVQRQLLVDAETGEPTTLTGKALEEAKKNKKVLTKAAYTQRNKRKENADLTQPHLKRTKTDNPIQSAGNSGRDIILPLENNSPDTPPHLSPTHKRKSEQSELELSTRQTKLHSTDRSPNTSFSLFPAVQIKQEPPEECIPVDIDQVMATLRLILQQKRHGDNTLTNCGHLTQYSIETLDHLLQGKAVPEKEIPTEHSGKDHTTSTAVTFKPVPLKSETGEKVGRQYRTVAATAIATLEGLHSILPPRITPYLNLTLHPPVESTYVELEATEIPKLRCKVNEISAKLRQVAREQNRILLGQLDLAYLGRNKLGHVIAFCATSEKVFYIDGHLYNGLTQTGEPIFTELTNTYQFATQMSPYTEGEFADDCFYLVHKQVPVSYSPMRGPAIC